VGAGSKSRRRWRRWLLLLGALLLSVAALVAGGLVWLRSISGGARIARELAARAERDYGLALAIERLRLDPLTGAFEISGVRLGAVNVPPILRVARISGAVDLGSLFSPTVVVRTLVLDGPVIDLNAPLPRLPATTASESAGSRRQLEILAFDVHEGVVSGVLVPAALRPHLDVSEVDTIALRGALRAGVATVDAHATAWVARPKQGVVPVDVEFSASAPLRGPLALRALVLRGPGVFVTAHGRGGPTSADPFELVAALALEPAILAPEFGLGGEIIGRCTLAGPELRGSGELFLSSFPGDALGRFLPAGTSEMLAVGDTTVAADLNFRIGSEAEVLCANGSLTWREPKAELARLAFDGGLAGFDVGPFRLGFEATLLSGSPGTRTARGVICGSDLRSLDSVELVEGTVELRIPAIESAHAELRQRWPALVPALPTNAPARGALELSATAHGTLLDPQVTGRVEWQPAPDALVVATATGRPATITGRAELDIGSLPITVLAPTLGGVVSAHVDVERSRAGLHATVVAEGRALCDADSGLTAERISLAARTDGHELIVDSLTAQIGSAGLSASGRASLASPLRNAELRLAVTNPVAAVSELELRASLADGVLALGVPGALTAAGPLAVVAEIPLAGLRHVPGLGERLAELPLALAEGPTHIVIAAPELDSCTLLSAVGHSDRAERAQAGVIAELWVDPATPLDAVGELNARGLTLTSAGGRVEAEEPLRLGLANHRLRLDPVRLQALGTSVQTQGLLVLAQRFRPGVDPLSALIESFGVGMRGRVDGALLAPYLPGAAVTGSLELAGNLLGTPAAPRGVVTVSGADFGVHWPLPYSTRVEHPELEVTLDASGAQIRSGRFTLNGGTVAATGSMSLVGDAEVGVELADVRYVLPYGLSIVAHGNLGLSLPAAGRGEIIGRLVVDRGVLTRDIDLERELASRVLAPPASFGTETSVLDTIDLDIGIETTEGVRVRNNVADLLARWQLLEVGGTAWSPVLRGRIEVDPGGLILAFGQTVRLERASATFRGDPVEDPEIDAVIARSAADSAAGGELIPGQASADAKLGAAETVTYGIVGYYGERLVSRLGESLGLGRIAIRPILLFGETDPSARLSLVKDISHNVAFAVSLDLRNAQRQTYLLDLHGLAALPRMQVQAYTQDDGARGLVLQQVLETKVGRNRDETGPVLDRIALVGPEGLPRRALRSALRLVRGVPLPVGYSLDAEVELAQVLRRRGFPDAGIRVATRPSERRQGRVDLVVDVEPGPQVRYVFAGDRPPRLVRPLITDLYRTDVTETAAREEVRKATVRAFRGQGHVNPEVTVESRLDDLKAPAGVRTVTITSAKGEKLSLETMSFGGLPVDEEVLLRGRFPGVLERIELAAGVVDADRRVVEALRVLGYPSGRVLGRTLSADRTQLRVDLEPGPRSRVARVTIEGLGADETTRLAGRLPLRVGGPARRDLLALSVLTIEDELQAQGFPEARVRSEMAPLDEATPLELAATLRVITGPATRVGGVEFRGARWSSDAFLTGVAGVRVGAPLDLAEVAAGRARLLQSGLFTQVASEVLPVADSSRVVSFLLEDRPRFSLAYGVRWQSDRGFGAVVDLIDHNLFGRGLTLGLRSFYDPEDRGGRLFLRLPGSFVHGRTFESYAEVRRETSGNLQTDRTEAAIQLALPHTARATTRVYARYRDTRLSEVEPDPFFPLDIRVRHPYFGVQYVLDTRSDPILATRGVFASVDVSGSAPAIGSDFRYIRGFAQTNVFLPVGRLAGRELIWAQSLRLGMARAFAGQELITDARFFAGGEYSVRGYERESLGPIEFLGGTVAAVGGSALLVVNQELRIGLPYDLTGVVFFDAGNVWQERGDFGRDLAKAIGLGVRASTPFGVLRLDLARPLDRRPEVDSKLKLYVGLGSVF
jgi:translocation and assembly module TamA